MTIHPFAAKPPPQELLINAGNLRREYHARKPDFTDGAQRVGFRHERSPGLFIAWLVQ